MTPHFYARRKGSAFRGRRTIGAWTRRFSPAIVAHGLPALGAFLADLTRIADRRERYLPRHDAIPGALLALWPKRRRVERAIAMGERLGLPVVAGSPGSARARLAPDWLWERVPTRFDAP